MKKKKIFFFNNGDDYLLRELNTINFFFKIKKDYTCNFFFKKKIKNKLKNKRIFCVKKKFRLILWTLIITLANDLSIKKSTPKCLHKELDKFCFHIQNIKLLFFINLIKKIKAQKIIIYLVSVILKKTNEFNYKYNKNEIFLIYDGVMSLEAFDIINHSNKYNNKSILILPNWDHASKCHLINPSLVLAWGETSKQRVKTVFNLNCNAIGTARFELAFKKVLEIKERKKINNKKYYKILFAGSIIPQDDISLLRKLNDHINKRKFKIKIIYRPHPFGFSQINLNLFTKYKNKFRTDNVYFDKSLLHDKKNDLKSYVSLFLEIDGLISSFSTLTLEAGIYKLPALCYAINIPKSKYYNLFNHEIQCRYLSHLYLLNKYSWPLKVYGATLFLDKFDELVSQITSTNSGNRDKIINNIIKKEIFYDDSEYYQRLKRQIDNI